MKIKIKPEKFRKIVDVGMIKTSVPMIDPITIAFDKDGATIKETFVEVIGVFEKLSKKFFTEFDVTEDENVSIPSVLTKTMSWKGFGGDNIDIFTDKTKINMKSKLASFSRDLDEPTRVSFPFKMIKTEFGQLPEKMEIKSVLKVKADDLIILTASMYEFVFDGKKLTVNMDANGNLSYDVPSEVVKNEPVKLKVNGDYYSSIVSNLSGEVNIILNKNMLIFTENGEEYSKTYFLGVLSDE